MVNVATICGDLFSGMTPPCMSSPVGGSFSSVTVTINVSSLESDDLPESVQRTTITIFERLALFS